MKTIILSVSGMNCGHCEHKVCKNLLKAEGIKGASASFKENKVMIRFNEAVTTEENIKKIITESGYALNKI